MADESHSKEGVEESSSLPAIGLVLGAVLFVAVLLAPPLPDMPPQAQRLAAVTALMAVYWLTQALPIAVTALVPLALFPLLGVQPADEVSKAYIDSNVFLYMGGFIIALGIERWGLHRRIALLVLRAIGTGPRRIVLGFMLATGFLSMWISNTAATLLMLPIALALASSLESVRIDDPEAAGRRDAAVGRLMVAVLLGTTYSATIGGMTTLVGTPTNLVFVQIWERSYPDADPVSAGRWMVGVVPVGALFLALAWAVLVRRLPALALPGSGQRSFFRDELRRLGPMARPEWMMLAVFALTAGLWLFRNDLAFADTTLVPGWGPWVEARLGTAEIHDSTVAMTMALAMFLLPAARDDSGRTVPLMDWKTAERLPWGILLLFGGGFALAGAFSSTGLAKWLGEVFASGISGWPPWLIVAGVCLLVTFLSELTSNVATCATLLPVLVGVVAALPIDPLLVLVPATLAASCGFMLPIATPPNAIVFGTGRIRMGEMARAGLILNLTGVVLITLAMFLYTGPALGVKDAPPKAAAAADDAGEATSR